ncbi:ATP-binding protein [Bacteroides sp. OttesenSCG-928-D19]|nr:ATP-binding protein [Bacteroides sp. OttesenSCG-928-N06]MDL2305227.1 ATP-binding protein [Bacteroides sp. OttesenSCG-928-D19]
MDERFNRLKKYNPWGENKIQTGFIRSGYTDKIYAYIGNRLIKVLIGQRRVGKSYILRQLASKLIEDGVNRENIFFLNLEFTEFDFVKTYKDLDELVKVYRTKLNPQGRIYLFIDEVQNVEGWERIINSYSQDYVDEYELFISGSNSKMLSGELATLLSGRYVSFEIFPFSFREYTGITNKEKTKQSFVDYMNSGGMPELFMLPEPELKRNYILALKDTILLRDIIQRHNIKDARLLEDVFVYLVNNASNLLSIRNIANFFKSNGRKSSYDTIATYIGYIEDTYLVHRAERYNIKGKETIAGNCKYYINDLSFNNHLYQGFGYGVGYMLENIVYLELVRNGFDVYVGNIKNKEVDFVAIKGERIIYIQSTYILTDKETIEREYSALQVIDDNYEKIVVSLDDIALPLNEGIRHIQAWELQDIF